MASCGVIPDLRRAGDTVTSSPALDINLGLRIPLGVHCVGGQAGRSVARGQGKAAMLPRATSPSALAASVVAAARLV